MTYPRDQDMHNNHRNRLIYWSHPSLQDQTIGVQVRTDAQSKNPMFCVRPGLGRYHLVWDLINFLLIFLFLRQRNSPISEFIFLGVLAILALLRCPNCVQVSIYLDAAEGQPGHLRMTQQYKNPKFRCWQSINARFKTIKSYAMICYPRDT